MRKALVIIALLVLLIGITDVYLGVTDHVPGAIASGVGFMLVAGMFFWVVGRR